MSYVKQHVVAFLILAIYLNVECYLKSNSWRETELWNSCSSCDHGTERRIFHCVQTDTYNTSILLTPENCGGETKLKEHLASFPRNQIERSCNWGSCQNKSLWRASEWNNCSRKCGNAGFVTREIRCILLGTENEIFIEREYEDQYCDPEKRPSLWAPCNRFDCPGEFAAEKWEKCKQSDPCSPGIQQRKLSCSSLTTQGTHRKLPILACYIGRKRPLSTWRQCILPHVSINCALHDPIIESSPFNVVQMREINKMQLQVGQQAHVIPSTRITIQCPVKYFQPTDILWKHRDRGAFKFMGQSRNPIRVDKKGSLQIRNFRISDRGVWTCYAGNNSATINLIVHQYSAGFLEWKQRSSLLNMEMLHEEPTAAGATFSQSLVQWIEGTWSRCSLTCGASGVQTRTVRCERVDSRYYHLLEDRECEKLNLLKPKTRRVCENPLNCPSWRFIKEEPPQCTGPCINIGLGSYRGNMICQLNDQTFPSHKCKDYVKPDISCANETCQVEWSSGPWSRCSKSCGTAGISFRPIICVWKQHQNPAGSLCYEQLQETPELLRKCHPPPCILDCIDLIPNCYPSLNFCSTMRGRYFCCKSCRNIAAQLGYLSMNQTLPKKYD